MTTSVILFLSIATMTIILLLVWSLPVLLQVRTVTTVDVLVPISTTAPNASFYPNIVHPRSPQRVNLPNKQAIHTNKFYTNPLLGQGNNPMLVHPYILLMNPSAPFGVSVSCTESVILGPKIDDTRVKYFINMILQNIRVGATEFTAQNFEVIDTDHPGLSLTLRMNQTNSAASITIPIVRGMAYVTLEFNSATPLISTEHAIISINNQTSGQTTASRFEVVLNNNQTWILYTLNGDITLNFHDNQLTGNQPVSNVLRLAKKQPDATANAALDSHVSVYPTGCQLQADVTGTKGTYTFLWNRKGDLSNTLLHYTFAHHRQVITSSSATPTTIQTRSSTKGVMIAYAGNSWTLVEDSLSTMGFLPPRAPPASYNEYIIAQLNQDIATGVNLNVSDYYFSGKAFHKYALLCLLTDYYNLTTLKEQCIQTIEAAFDVLLTAKNSNALRYDTTWYGLVSSAGLGPSQELADFGNSYYNDHHYHWGYYIQTGALIAHLDPTYIPKMRSWIEGLIRDANNPSIQDTSFPQFRLFDWFTGHSWSQGLFESADGKDQESTSEETNYHYGVALWGLATQSSTIESIGRLMLAVAKRSIQTYFLMRSDNDVMLKEFIGNKVTGIFFDNKADYTTWFGGNPEYIHGIQMIPATPITEEVRLPKFVEEEWSTILSKIIGNVAGGWKGVLYTSYATLNPAEAFAQLRNVPLDDGLSRAWALFWAATRPGNNDTSSTLPPTTTNSPQPSGDQCTMPVEKTCTSMTSPGDLATGLGMYYDTTCAQGGIGCGHIQTLCRLCAKNPERVNKPYPACPSCV